MQKLLLKIRMLSLLGLVLLGMFTTLSFAQDAALENYVIGAGDTIAIQVFDEPDLSMQTRIGDNGIINYSYLGDVVVAGKSAAELEQHLIELFKNGYLVNPSVNVSITGYRPFYISGEVQSPGSYPYEPGLTVERAITVAGGLTDRASRRKIYLTRIDDDGSEKRNKVSMDTKVLPKDTISIKEGFF